MQKTYPRVFCRKEERMIIIGLGNPGEEYADTYHNMGYMVVEKLAELMNKKINRAECSALTTVKENGDEKIVLAKPLTYMNLSGAAVKSLMSKYRQSADEIIVIYDDIDIPRYSVRVREKGSAGTHNGMRNIVSVIGTENFKRIRMGIGREDRELKDYVLGKIPSEDLKAFGETAEKIARLIAEYIKTKDFDRLMREGNSIK